MLHGVRRRLEGAYERLLEREISGTPTHVAVIQDGNRRYAREQGEADTQGHRAGADTTEQVLRWCGDLGIEELTLYAFSTENFERPPDEREERRTERRHASTASRSRRERRGFRGPVHSVRTVFTLN